MTGQFSKVTCIVAPGVPDMFLQAAKRILPLHDLTTLQGEPVQRTGILNGIVLEHILGDFLAGPSRTHDDP